MPWAASTMRIRGLLSGCRNPWAGRGDLVSKISLNEMLRIGRAATVDTTPPTSAQGVSTVANRLHSSIVLAVDGDVVLAAYMLRPSSCSCKDSGLDDHYYAVCIWTLRRCFATGHAATHFVSCRSSTAPPPAADMRSALFVTSPVVEVTVAVALCRRVHRFPRDVPDAGR